MSGAARILGLLYFCEISHGYVLENMQGTRYESLRKLPQGDRMKPRPPRCVLIAYDEDGQQIETFTVDRAAVAALREKALVVPWSLEEQNFELDDEFARKLGGVVLLLLATSQPELSPYITVTRNDDSAPPAS